MLEFLYSLFYFCSIMILAAAGFGLSITWVGIPIVVFLFKTVQSFTKNEISTAEKLLPIKIGEINYSDNNYSNENLLGKFKVNIKDRLKWKHLIFHLIKFPLTVITFSLCAVLVTIPSALVAAPLLYNIVPYSFITFEITTFYQSLILFVLG